MDDRRLEAPHCGGEQLAVDTTLVLLLLGQGQPVRVAGGALALAGRRKERAWQMPVAVLAVEVGGRWSDEAASFIRSATLLSGIPERQFEQHAYTHVSAT